MTTQLFAISLHNLRTWSALMGDRSIRLICTETVPHLGCAPDLAIRKALALIASLQERSAMRMLASGDGFERDSLTVPCGASPSLAGGYAS